MFTGEYLVLDGAQALAVPTVLGQALTVQFTDETDVLHWVSKDFQGEVWFEEAYSRSGLKLSPPAIDKSPEARLARMLQRIFADHPRLWPRGRGIRFEATLEFDRSWGFGSSATLAYLLACFAGANAYELNHGEFGGSGYDVACAGANGPLLYRLKGGRPQVKQIAWNPSALGETFLVHLGDKQNSREGIKNYRSQAEGDLSKFAAELDVITNELLAVTNVHHLADIMRRHEALVGYVTRQMPIGKARFADFPGTVKSLGAWGGDFALVIPTQSVDVPAYFETKGLTTLYPTRHLLSLEGKPTPVASDNAEDWPVFLYGPLAEPQVSNEWLAGHRYFQADLMDHQAGHDGDRITVSPQEGKFVPGTVVFLPSDELRQLDLHPEGAGYVRKQGQVRYFGGKLRALFWS